MCLTFDKTLCLEIEARSTRRNPPRSQAPLRDVVNAESVTQRSPGLPDEGGQPWVNDRINETNPEWVLQISWNDLHNSFRVAVAIDVHTQGSPLPADNPGLGCRTPSGYTLVPKLRLGTPPVEAPLRDIA